MLDVRACRSSMLATCCRRPCLPCIKVHQSAARFTRRGAGTPCCTQDWPNGCRPPVATPALAICLPARDCPGVLLHGECALPGCCHSCMAILHRGEAATSKLLPRQAAEPQARCGSRRQVAMARGVTPLMFQRV